MLMQLLEGHFVCKKYLISAVSKDYDLEFLGGPGLEVISGRLGWLNNILYIYRYIILFNDGEIKLLSSHSLLR